MSSKGLNKSTDTKLILNNFTVTGSQTGRGGTNQQYRSVSVQDGSCIVNEECYHAVPAPAQGPFTGFCPPMTMGPSPFEGWVIMPDGSFVYMPMAYPAQYCN